MTILFGCHGNIKLKKMIFMPPLLKAEVGHTVFHHDVMSVRAYVTFVTRFKFTCKFRCNFMSAFLLQLITFIPFGLES